MCSSATSTWRLKKRGVFEDILARGKQSSVVNMSVSVFPLLTILIAVILSCQKKVTAGIGNLRDGSVPFALVAKADREHTVPCHENTYTM